MNKNPPFQDWLDANTQGYAFSQEIRVWMAKAFEGGQHSPQSMHPEMKKLWEDYFDNAYKQLEPIVRPWIDLTHGELMALYASHHDVHGHCNTAWGYEDAITAKLKEKNS